MRWLLAIPVAAGLLASTSAMPQRIDERASAEAVQTWIFAYRGKPEPSRVPAAYRALEQLGYLKDPEQSGIYVGFLAGVIGTNPSRAEELIVRTIPMVGSDQWLIVRAIAYSGLPDWKGVLAKVGDRMPTKSVMVQTYLSGELPTLHEAKLERDKPRWDEQLRNSFKFDKLTDKLTGREQPATPPKRDVTFETNPELMDTLWGYYFATGAHSPIARIISMLPWSNDHDSVEKLTAGSTAKFTLANYASRDPKLLAVIKTLATNQPKNVAPVLKEVILAAETVNITAIHREQLNAIDELKRKGPQYRRDANLWAQIGQGALALGCVVAAALGQIEFGIPCVVGGGVSSAAVYYWNSQQ
jgi:hypothetical protein